MLAVAGLIATCVTLCAIKYGRDGIPPGMKLLSYGSLIILFAYGSGIIR